MSGDWGESTWIDGHYSTNEQKIRFFNRFIGEKSVFENEFDKIK